MLRKEGGELGANVLGTNTAPSIRSPLGSELLWPPGRVQKTIPRPVLGRLSGAVTGGCAARPPSFTPGLLTPLPHVALGAANLGASGNSVPPRTASLRTERGFQMETVMSRTEQPILARPGVGNFQAPRSQATEGRRKGKTCFGRWLATLTVCSLGQGCAVTQVA